MVDSQQIALPTCYSGAILDVPRFGSCTAREIRVIATVISKISVSVRDLPYCLADRLYLRSHFSSEHK